MELMSSVVRFSTSDIVTLEPIYPFFLLGARPGRKAIGSIYISDCRCEYTEARLQGAQLEVPHLSIWPHPHIARIFSADEDECKVERAGSWKLLTSSSYRPPLAMQALDHRSRIPLYSSDFPGTPQSLGRLALK